MQDILELERRIAAAFDRIDRGLEQADRARARVSALQPEAGQEAGLTDAAETDALRRDLEAAQVSSADWARRYAALEAQLAETTLSMTGQIAKLTEDLAATSADIEVIDPAAALLAQSELQAMQDQMTELRRQIAAQEVELTQLRSQRSTEIEELKSIVAALTPLIEEANPHA